MNDSTENNATEHVIPVQPERGIVARVAAWLIKLVVLLYRATLQPFMGGHCRYEPSCSQYMLDAVTKYGPWRGFIKGIRRILRCHPWGGQGHDPA